MTNQELKIFLNKKVNQYNRKSFIENDPVCIPHLFSKKQDIEIAGLFAAVFAWGQRKTIINKSKELMQLMDMQPHDFILHHDESDLKKFSRFKHRTFNYTDTLYFIHFLQNYYSKHNSLEDAFLPKKKESNMENALIRFHDLFFSLEDSPNRTRKHIPTPARKSSCKRLNMYLRWMVRRDTCGVDFGIWKKIKPSQLICPVDLHVERVARKLGLINRKNADWQTVVELTDSLKQFDANDPVKYDFALFGIGVMEKIK
ncbi:TIGR02757 family protein [Bacteroidota bacterium]|nr:TIGR02757 family protein [Bacteroidota bacterium]